MEVEEVLWLINGCGKLNSGKKLDVCQLMPYMELVCFISVIIGVTQTLVKEKLDFNETISLMTSNDISKELNWIFKEVYIKN